MTENNKSIPDGYTKEQLEILAKDAWTLLINPIINSGENNEDKCFCEKAEIIEEAASAFS